jgi:hypothetical protein
MVEPVNRSIMKKIIHILLLTFLVSGFVDAQVTLTFNISYPAPTYLSDWSFTRSGVAIVTFTPAGVATQLIKFATRIQSLDGTTIAASNNNSAVIYTLQRGPNTFMLDKLLQLENLRFTDGSIIRSIQNTGKLPVVHTNTEQPGRGCFFESPGLQAIYPGNIPVAIPFVACK